jgi:hypothetical protein
VTWLGRPKSEFLSGPPMIEGRGGEGGGGSAKCGKSSGQPSCHLPSGTPLALKSDILSEQELGPLGKGKEQTVR